MISHHCFSLNSIRPSQRSGSWGTGLCCTMDTVLKCLTWWRTLWTSGESRSCFLRTLSRHHPVLFHLVDGLSQIASPDYLEANTLNRGSRQSRMKNLFWDEQRKQQGESWTFGRIFKDRIRATQRGHHQGLRLLCCFLAPGTRLWSVVSSPPWWTESGMESWDSSTQGSVIRLIPKDVVQQLMDSHETVNGVMSLVRTRRKCFHCFIGRKRTWRWRG